MMLLYDFLTYSQKGDKRVGFYIVYGIVAIFIIGVSIVMLVKKKIHTPILVLVPTIFSLFFFWLFAYANHYWAIVCDESEGCMNETGILGAISFFFIFVAIIILISSLSISMIIKLRKKTSIHAE